MDEQSKRRQRRDGFTAGTKQRNRTLDIVFETDERGLLDQGDLLALFGERRVTSTSQSPIWDSGASIVEVYAENTDDIDTIVEATSEDWAMGRMNAVNRSILRAVAAELVYVSTDRFHVIPEQASLAREYPMGCSVGFVMGVLNRVADTRTRELAGGRELSGSEEADGQEAN